MTEPSPTPARHPRWAVCLLVAGAALLVLAALYVTLNREPAPQAQPERPAGMASIDLEATQRRAEQGDAAAQTLLGEAYLHGRGTKPDARAATNWLMRAAAQGHAPAEYTLGMMCEAGNGMPFDYAQAMAWYRQSAFHGHAPAQYSLAVMFSHGRGVPRNDVAAIRWLTRAAQAGEGLAQFALGHRCSAGSGVLQDPAEAFKWFTLAAARNTPDAATSLRELQAGMSRSQIAEGRRRAAGFVPTRFSGTVSPEP
jgi:uncharacterized protein